MKRSITIHHFEDEPEHVRWIAGTLLNRYWLSHAEWVKEEGRFDEADKPKSSWFELEVGPDVYRILHRLYETPEEFRSSARGIQRNDIVLLDLSMGRHAEMPGLALYKLAVQRVGVKRAYVLSAFAHVALADGVPADQVIQKPPDPTLLINVIMDRLAIGEAS